MFLFLIFQSVVFISVFIVFFTSAALWASTDTVNKKNKSGNYKPLVPLQKTSNKLYAVWNSQHNVSYNEVCFFSFLGLIKWRELVRQVSHNLRVNYLPCRLSISKSFSSPIHLQWFENAWQVKTMEWKVFKMAFSRAHFPKASWT